MEKGKILLNLLVTGAMILSMITISTSGSDERTRTGGNESFETATEIPSDGSLYSGSLNFNNDPVDFLKFFLDPPGGKSLNASIHVTAESATHAFFIVVYSPDKLLLHYEMIQHGGQPMDFSFWSGSDYYYMSVATPNNGAAYGVRVNTTIVNSPPDGNNNMSHAPIITPNATFKETVKKTSDYFDIYRVNINANETHGDGLYVHLNNFTDVNLEVYDPNKILREESSISWSSDPKKGETVRFVANQTGYYYIVVMFEIFFPDGDFANYDIMINTTADLPRDEDWCMEKASPIAQGLHEGFFDSKFDINDFYSLNFQNGDDVNVSVMVPGIQDWSIGIRIINSSGDSITSGYSSGNDYSVTGDRIPEDGVYYIQFENKEWKRLNYTYMITTDGKHLGNVRPMTLNQTSTDYSFPEDTSGTFQLSDVFNKGAPRTFNCSSHELEDGKNLTVTLDETGEVTIVPVNDWFGSEKILFQCRDYFNHTENFTLNTTVTAVNDPPRFVDIGGEEMPAVYWLHANENEWYNISFNVSDTDDDPLELNISVATGNSNLIYNTTTGIFQYFTDDGSLIVDTFTVSVSDGILNDTQTIKVDVIDVNDPPIAKPIRLVSGGNKDLTVSLATDEAYDEEGISLTCLWSFGDGLDSIGFNMYSVTHTYAEAGTYTVELEVNDTVYQDYSFLDITVTAPPDPPLDTDGDGIPDDNDSFPSDAAASIDIDADGYPDEWNLGKSQVDSTTGLILDLFPEDSLHHADSDGDGMPDGWEITWGLNLTNPKDATKDTDGDKISNYWEYVYGTNPGFKVVTVDEMPWLWKNVSKSYLDKKGDELYQIIDDWYDNEKATLRFSEYGNRSEIDFLKLTSTLNGTYLHVVLTTKGKPIEEKKIPMSEDGLFMHVPYSYILYFVDENHIEHNYNESSIGSDLPSDRSPIVLFNLSFKFPDSFPELDYEMFIEGNSIVFDIPLKTLVEMGLEPSSRFGLFATSTFFRVSDPPKTRYHGYDSIGDGAYILPTGTIGDDDVTPGTGNDTTETAQDNTALIVIGGGAVIIVIAVIIVLAIVMSKKRKNDEGNKTDIAEEKSPSKSIEEETEKLIEEAQKIGLRVTGFQDDLERALDYLKNDERELIKNLSMLCTRIRTEIDREKGVTEPPPTVTAEGDASTQGAVSEGIERAPIPPEQIPVPAAVQAPVCPRCNQASTYYPEHDCFWCEPCQDYVIAMETPAFPQAEIPSDEARGDPPPPMPP